MPTLTHDEMRTLSGAVEEIKTILTGTINIDSVAEAHDALGNVLTALLLCENPDGLLPEYLEPGDRVQLNGGQWVTVDGYPLATEVDGESVIAVLSTDSVLLFPALQNVDAA